MRYLKIFLFSTVILLGFSCQEPVDYSNVITDGHYLNQAQDRVTQVIIHDIFSPPVAARIYSYASIAAYEVAAATDPSYASLFGQLRGSESITFSPSEKVYPPLAALSAYYTMGTALIFSEEMMNEKGKEYQQMYSKHPSHSDKK